LKQLTTLLAAGSLMLAGGTASALTIDDFTTGKIDFPGVFAPPNSGGNVGTQTGSMLGGDREILLTSLAGGVATVLIPTTRDSLVWSNADDGRSTVVVTWDNGFDEDLTAGPGGEVATGFFLGIPNPIDNRLTITLAVTGGGNSGSDSESFPDGASGTDFFFPFADFDGSIDFTSVTSIVMTLTSPDNGFDGAVEFVETRPRPTPVPGTIALLGLGLVGMAARRRVKRA
jgi:hypothetical protein